MTAIPDSLERADALITEAALLMLPVLGEDLTKDMIAQLVEDTISDDLHDRAATALKHRSHKVPRETGPDLCGNG